MKTIDNIVYMERQHSGDFVPKYLQHNDPLIPGCLRFKQFSKYLTQDFFLISIINPRAVEYINCKDILKDYYNLLINKELLLIIEYTTDGVYTVVDNIYKHLVLIQGIDPKQIVLLGGTIDYKTKIEEVSKELNKDYINLEIYYRYEEENLHRFYQDININIDINTPYPNIENPFKKNKFTKKFLNFNGMYRSHRLALLSLLHNKNLINDGYISFAKFNDSIWLDTVELAMRDLPYLKDDIQQGLAFRENLPLVLDVKDFYQLDLASVVRSSMSYYKKTYFSIVGETYFRNRYPRFITEKIIKTFMFKHPFITLSSPYTLEVIKDMGYKTFDPIINESYDKIYDDSERLRAIIQEIDRLCHLTSDELRDFCTIAYEITEHNFKVLSNKKHFFSDKY